MLVKIRGNGNARSWLGECKNGAATSEYSLWQCLAKLNFLLTNDSVTGLPSIYPNELKT